MEWMRINQFKANQELFKDYLSYLDYLVLTGVLETEGQYIRGKQSKGYRFTERYANAPLVRYEKQYFCIEQGEIFIIPS